MGRWPTSPSDETRDRRGARDGAPRRSAVGRAIGRPIRRPASKRSAGKDGHDLLLAIGVDSPQKLLMMEPQELVRLMDEQKKTRKLVGGVPKLAEVEEWRKELRAPAFAHAK